MVINTTCNGMALLSLVLRKGPRNLFRPLPRLITRLRRLRPCRLWNGPEVDEARTDGNRSTVS